MRIVSGTARRDTATRAMRIEATAWGNRTTKKGSTRSSAGPNRFAFPGLIAGLPDM